MIYNTDWETKKLAEDSMVLQCIDLAGLYSNELKCVCHCKIFALSEWPVGIAIHCYGISRVVIHYISAALLLMLGPTRRRPSTPSPHQPVHGPFQNESRHRQRGPRHQQTQAHVQMQSSLSRPHHRLRDLAREGNFL